MPKRGSVTRANDPEGYAIEFSPGIAEVLAYGTAVRLRK